MDRPWRRLALRAAPAAAALLLAGAAVQLLRDPGGSAGPVPVVTPRSRCLAERARDQDDLCVWVHPADPGRSLIVASDKVAERVFVYDLEGRVLQEIATAMPGNIDARYGFPLGGRRIDIVAWCERRGEPRIRVCAVDPVTRRLEQVDDGAIGTGPSSGGTLHRSPRTGRFYYFKTEESDEGAVEQIELLAGPGGRVSGRRVRSWSAGECEGAVADDEAGRVFISAEKRGIWAVGGEPGDPAPGELIARVGEHGLAADVEGLALYLRPEGEGYLIASNQSRSRFEVYDRRPPHRHLGAFGVEGARETDGIDVVSAGLGERFPRGLFACHGDPGWSPCPVLLTPWEEVAGALGLAVDTSWRPRH